MFQGDEEGSQGEGQPPQAEGASQSALEGDAGGQGLSGQGYQQGDEGDAVIAHPEHPVASRARAVSRVARVQPKLSRTQPGAPKSAPSESPIPWFSR